MPPETPHCKDGRHADRGSSTVLDAGPDVRGRGRAPRARARRRGGLGKATQPRVEGTPQGRIDPGGRHGTRPLPAYARPHAAHQPGDRRRRRMQPGSAKRRADRPEPTPAIETGLGEDDRLPEPPTSPGQFTVYPRQHPGIGGAAQQVARRRPPGQRDDSVGRLALAKTVNVPRHSANARRRDLANVDVESRPPQPAARRRAYALHRPPSQLQRGHATEPHHASNPQGGSHRPRKRPTQPLPQRGRRRSETDDRLRMKASLDERDDHGRCTTQAVGQPRFHRLHRARARGGPRAGR